VNSGRAVSLYHCIIGEPPSVEAWQYLTDLRLTDWVSPDVETLRAESSSRLFMSGKLAIWPGGSWNMKTLEIKKDY
jgi:ABC-type glycerol-3-phosphate transport system substrate-binding protein